MDSAHRGDWSQGLQFISSCLLPFQKWVNDNIKLTLNKALIGSVMTYAYPAII